MLFFFEMETDIFINIQERQELKYKRIIQELSKN